MSKSVTLTVRITTIGDGFNHTDVYQITNNAAATSSFFSVSGTPFFGPPGAIPNGTVLVPPGSTSGQPSSSGVSKTLIGSAGDLGFPLNPATPVVASSASLGIAYGTAENVAAIYF